MSSMKITLQKCLHSITEATVDMILGPPDPPITSLAFWLLSSRMVGDIEEVGIAPGLIKLYLEGGSP